MGTGTIESNLFSQLSSTCQLMLEVVAIADHLARAKGGFHWYSINDYNRSGGLGAQSSARPGKISKKLGSVGS